MFLKNWDMLHVYRNQYTTTGRKVLEDKEIRTVDNTGNTGKWDSPGTTNGVITLINNFQNAGYGNNGSNGDTAGHFIWPGGDIDGQPQNIRPITNREIVRYEDFDLYSPFKGKTTPSSGQIYGQPHVLSSAIYNEEKGQWEKTVTREFKNESGHTITVREIGFYFRYSSYSNFSMLLAREILDTPIEVANDSYFKISFTYKVENPHEHREMKRVRQYTLPLYYSGHGSTKEDKTFSPALSNQKKRFLLITSYDIYNKTQITDEQLEQYYKKIPFTCEGWIHEKHIGHYSLYDKEVNNSNEQTLIMMDIFTPDDTENNKISIPGYGTVSNYSGNYVIFNVLFLEDSIETLSWDKETGLTRFDTSSSVEVTKLSNEKVIWISSQNPISQQTSFTYQEDFDFCDNLDYYGNYGSDFIIDNTPAISHIFRTHYNSNYEGGAIAKLTVEMKDDTPLYEDVPVQR